MLRGVPQRKIRITFKIWIDQNQRAEIIRNVRGHEHLLIYAGASGTEHNTSHKIHLSEQLIP